MAIVKYRSNLKFAPILKISRYLHYTFCTQGFQLQISVTSSQHWRFPTKLPAWAKTTVRKRWRRKSMKDRSFHGQKKNDCLHIVNNTSIRNIVDPQFMNWKLNLLNLLWVLSRIICQTWEKTWRKRRIVSFR